MNSGIYIRRKRCLEVSLPSFFCIAIFDLLDIMCVVGLCGHRVVEQSDKQVGRERYPSRRV